MNKIIWGDALQALKSLPDAFVQTCITSPPYFGLRDYGVDGQMGLEEAPGAFTQKIVEVFREVHRVLRNDATLWLNMGDSYAGSGKGAYADGIVRLGDKSQKQKGSTGTHQGTFTKTRSPGLKPKDLIGIPWRVAFALQADGWYLRQDIIWHKPNPMPESVTDRCTKAHEYIFLLSKSAQYYFNCDAIKEPAAGRSPRTVPYGWGQGSEPRTARELQKAGVHRKTFERNEGGSGTGFKGHSGNTKADGTVFTDRHKRSVWTVPSKPYKGAHFATFPPDLIVPCILASSKAGDIVLDPFAGSGTTGSVAKKHGRQYLLIELNPHYLDLINERLGNTPSPLAFSEAAE